MKIVIQDKNIRVIWQFLWGPYFYCDIYIWMIKWLYWTVRCLGILLVYWYSWYDIGWLRLFGRVYFYSKLKEELLHIFLPVSGVMLHDPLYGGSFTSTINSVTAGNLSVSVTVTSSLYLDPGSNVFAFKTRQFFSIPEECKQETKMSLFVPLSRGWAQNTKSAKIVRLLSPALSTLNKNS